MHRGFIVLWRKFQETSFYRDSDAKSLALHLILEANHEPRKFLFNGKEEILERGQHLTGRDNLAADLNIPPRTVYDKLKMLERVSFITLKSNNKFTIVTVCNYSRYQNIKEETQQPPNNRPTTSQQPANTNNNTTIITTKNNNTVTQYDFESVWARYPKRLGKAKALRSFTSGVKTDKDFADINCALDKYLAHIGDVKVEYKYIQHGSTWFNNWRDWIDYESNGQSTTAPAPC